MANVREIKEGRQEQGTEEEITYTLTVPATWGTPSGTPTIKVYSYDGSTYTDVTSTIIPAGSATVLVQVITLPELKSMTADTTYRVEMKFTTSEGNIMEPYAWIDCKR